MIKKIKLLNKDEIYAILGVQDRNLKALEKEFKITVTISYDDENGDAELSLNGLHSRVDKAYAKIQKNLDILRVPRRTPPQKKKFLLRAGWCSARRTRPR